MNHIGRATRVIIYTIMVMLTFLGGYCQQTLGGVSHTDVHQTQT